MILRWAFLLLLCPSAGAVKIPLRIEFEGEPPREGEWTAGLVLHGIIQVEQPDGKALRRSHNTRIRKDGTAILSFSNLEAPGPVELELEVKRRLKAPFAGYAARDISLSKLETQVLRVRRVHADTLHFRLESALNHQPAAGHRISLKESRREGFGRRVSLKTDAQGAFSFPAWRDLGYRLQGAHRNFDMLDRIDLTEEMRTNAREQVQVLTTRAPDLSGSVFLRDAAGAVSPYLGTNKSVRVHIETRQLGTISWRIPVHIEGGRMYSYHTRSHTDLAGLDIKLSYQFLSGGATPPALDVWDHPTFYRKPGDNMHDLDLVLADASIVAKRLKARKNRRKGLATGAMGAGLLAVLFTVFSMYNRRVLARSNPAQ